jgi:hypothetical protein
MELRTTPHRHACTAVGILAFVVAGPAIAVIVLGIPRESPPVMHMILALIAGGISAFIAYSAFTRSVPAICTACGAASAFATTAGGMTTVYVCRACRAERSVEYINHLEEQATIEAGGTPPLKMEFFAGLLFVVVGLALVGAGYWQARETIGLLREGISTDAKVLRVTQRETRDTDGDRETTFTALIQYHAGKDPHTLERSWSVPFGGHCVWPCYKEGQQIKVIYRASQPSQAKVHTTAELSTAPAMFGSVGALFVVVGGLIAWQQWRKRRRG